MNDTQKQRLANGVFILPDEITHALYEDLLEALLVLRPHDEVRLFCRGDGGGTRTTLAIVDLIAQHGNVTGVLHGAAFSAHGLVWASCQRRYVSPNGCIGLHKVAGTDYGQMDSTYARHIAAEYERVEQIAAELLARISGRTSGFWYDLMQDAGSSGCKIVEAARLIDMRMAHPLSALPPLSAPDVVRAEAVETI